MQSHILSVLFFSLLSSSIAEGLSYQYVYKTEKYQRLKERVVRNEAELKEKTQSTGGNLVKRQRRIEVLEQQLKQTRKEAQSLQFKTSIFSAVVQMIMIYFVNSMYSGIPVAKLPFTPIGLFQGITHRGLEGTDYTECSAMFLFIIGTLVSKSLLEKVLGFAIPKSGNTVPEWVTNPEALLDGLQKQR